MRFHADLHIHSKYSRACSKDCDLEHLAWWARRKGVTVVGTGDFTHPAWFEHLQENLVPAEPGLFRLRDEVDDAVRRTLPPSLAAAPVRFMLSVEISTIYKRADRTRKVHHLVYVPDLEAAALFNQKLGRIGNLGSDGRPILGLDSRDLLEITLECGDGAYLVPAHVWTPWFAVLGSKSGFDAIGDCYVDLADHIFAIETGLSSDPAMNWRVSGLDRYRLVSSSDAHSPPILGREATVFDTDLDYHAVRRALETGVGHAGTIEFFPEEGKYHVDGHRNCGVRLEPHETRRHGGVCPTCGKPLTVGVLSRVEELADRPDGFRPDGAAGFRNLVPLPEIMSEILGTGPKSKKVVGEIDKLTAALGPELTILEDVPVDDIAPRWPVLAEAVGRLRRGEVHREAGYDGEYGVIRLFEPGELHRASLVNAPALFEDSLLAAPEHSPAQTASRADVAPVATSAAPNAHPEATSAPALVGRAVVPTDASDPTGRHVVPTDAPHPTARDVVSVGAGDPSKDDGSLLGGLDPDQRAAAESVGGPLLIVAGPGTGKTRTLTHRIAHLVTRHGVPAEQCLAITFTRRAAEELSERLAALVPGHAGRVTVATFHSLGVRILREHHERAGLSRHFGIADPGQQLAVLAEVTGSETQARRLLPRLSTHRRASPTTTEADMATATATGTATAIGTATGTATDIGTATGTGDSPGDLELVELADRYVKALRQQDLVDFDDLIALPVALLEADPALAATYHDRYRWVSVDEYQDVDRQQHRLLRQLVPPGGNLTVIADPDQSIYGFRGADVELVERFAHDHPGARRVQLTRNYRSSPAVVAAALQVIAPTTLVPDRVLRPQVPVGRGGADRIGLHHAATEQAEASFVARTIEQLLGGTSFHSLDSRRVESGESGSPGGWGFSDFAVLYRTDRQARAVMEALTQAGMPFQKRSHDRLSDRPGVARIVAALHDPAPTPAPTGDEIGRPDPVRRGSPLVGGEATSPIDTEATAATEEPVGGRVVDRLRWAARACLDGLPVDERDDVAADVHSAVELLRPLAERAGDDLEWFRTELALGVEVDTWDPRADRISLLTLHAAKGLEFPVVFVVGCEDGLLPLRWPGTSPGDVDEEQVREERRLLFVGMTRARRRLYLSHAAERARPGATRRTGRSPFLADIHPAGVEQIGDATPRRRPRETQMRLL